MAKPEIKQIARKGETPLGHKWSSMLGLVDGGRYFVSEIKVWREGGPPLTLPGIGRASYATAEDADAAIAALVDDQLSKR